MNVRLLVLGALLLACSAFTAQPAAACHPETLDGGGASNPHHHGCGGPKENPTPEPSGEDPSSSPNDSVDDGTGGGEPSTAADPDGGSSAERSAVRECGDLQKKGAGVYNVTSRRVRCPRARRVARRYYNSGAGNGRALGFRCRQKQLGSELFDVRCTRRGKRVVRFQYGS